MWLLLIQWRQHIKGKWLIGELKKNCLRFCSYKHVLVLFILLEVVMQPSTCKCNVVFGLFFLEGITSHLRGFIRYLSFLPIQYPLTPDSRLQTFHMMAKYMVVCPLTPTELAPVRPDEASWMIWFWTGSWMRACLFLLFLFSIYSSLKCRVCRSAAGTVIHSAPPRLATVRSLFLLNKANIRW